MERYRPWLNSKKRQLLHLRKGSQEEEEDRAERRKDEISMAIPRMVERFDLIDESEERVGRGDERGRGRVRFYQPRPIIKIIQPRDLSLYGETDSGGGLNSHRFDGSEPTAAAGIRTGKQRSYSADGRSRERRAKSWREPSWDLWPVLEEAGSAEGSDKSS